MKERFISAYMWMYGCSRKEACRAFSKADTVRRELIVSAFENNSKKSFYED